MNDFFKFDDRRIVSSILLTISVFLLILSVLSIKVTEVFWGVVITLIILVTASIFTFNEGLHFCYKDEKIVIVQGMKIKILSMNDVINISIKEIPKTRKSILTQKLVDTVDRINTPSKYVYNKGKVFDITIYLKNKETVKVYYGWLYRTNSMERIDKQIENFNIIKDRFVKYKRSHHV